MSPPAAFSPVIWPRAILLVDMDAFFASVEQLDHPEWAKKPLAITNGEVGSTIITCSYEARQYGVKTGMRLNEAQRLCPSLIRCPSHPQRYIEISRAIMAALENTISPDIEVYSIDEAFIDVTHCQRLLGTPARIAHIAQQLVYEISGLSCSVGASGDKTTAKYAAKLHKPEGIAIIPPWESKQRLSNVPVTELWGINKGIGEFLARYGAYRCGDVAKLPISLLAKRFGNIGRRIWYQCQGMDPEHVKTLVAAPKSMGHGKVTPPNTTDKSVITTYLLHMCEKLAKRLRAHKMQAKHFFIGCKTSLGWIGGKYSLATATHDSKAIYEYARYLIDYEWEGQGVYQVQVTALDPKPAFLQMDLFEAPTIGQDKKHHAMDAINQRFGEFTLAPARLLMRSSMPNVIAPSWKPKGHRQTIDK